MSHRLPYLDRDILTINDLKTKAGTRVPVATREWLEEGAMDLIILKDNEEAYNRYKLRPRTLRNVHDLDMSATVFGTKVSIPFGFSPAGHHATVHPDGEVATSRAAAKNNIAMALSAYASYDLTDVMQQGQGNPYAIHVCIYRNRRKTLQILQRAEAAGFKAVIVSVDIPVLGLRLSEYRNDFKIPTHVKIPMLKDEGETGPTDPEELALDDSLAWSELIPWLRFNTNMEIWLKGITSPEDVALAVGHGVDGVVISNHGGRQLDGVPASLDALRECAPIAKGKIKIAVDGGIRRGSDIFKALALGADFCLAGRIPLWGLAYNGEDGVDLALKILTREFRTTMALCGCSSVSEISKEHLSVIQGEAFLSRL
ncbi:hypothetical protein M409DRAFT_20709 [Zasmidium cellare ATCC 36951]|uniref:Oxidase FUB9 n=1 Tax=Zasmidium cellare ATCC 36951 TaxID=1080233 RepID=A0A6A6CQY0_ZASCE|nr:uncharacterized protein M409DRAFT_20709 [Zasmidium cellare ATCC 36951]KAF2169495.1 hypothetical protein M409DRAFT_20709 [Zasmidium cellare ATCC 36951]